MAERNLRNRTLPASEIDESENQANSLGEGCEVGVEAETSTDESEVAVAPTLLARQDGSVEPSAVREPENVTLPTNQLHVLLLNVSGLKADIATAVETLNSNFKAENVKLAADITSSLTSQLTSIFRAENQELAEELTATFQAETVKLREELSQKIQNEVTNMSQDFSALRNDTDKELQQVKGTIEGISDDLHEKINANIVDTRKGIERIAHEVNARSKSPIEEMQK